MKITNFTGVAAFAVVLVFNVVVALGQNWSPLGSGMDDEVDNIAIYDGNLVAGGTFSTAGGISAERIAAWNGSIWQPLGSGMNSYVIALSVYDGKLFAGGWFTTAGGVSAKYIAGWDGSNWSPLGSGMSGYNYNYVEALTVYEGKLVAGGWFTTAGGATVNYIAAWDGSSWSPLGSGMNDAVYALTVYDGKLIAGGYFTTAGGVAANRVASWDGTSWSPLSSAMNGKVNSLAVYDGKLVAGGLFTTAGGATVNYIAAWDGSSWSPLGTGMNDVVYPLAVYRNKLIAGGVFTVAGGVSANHIASWNGSSWSTLGSGMDGAVSSFAVYQDKLIAGGPFTTAGGIVVNHIAAWAETTPVKVDIKPGSCPNPLNILAEREYLFGDESGSDLAQLDKARPGGPPPDPVLPVAILGTADFNVTEIVPSSVTLEGVPVLRWSIEDVATPVRADAAECECNNLGADGYKDLTLKFSRVEIVQTLGAVNDGDVVPLTISGELTDGTLFEGTDCVLIIGNREGASPAGISSLPFGLANYPNPFNPSTEIQYQVQQPAPVKLDVFDISGRKVRTLVDENKVAGEYRVIWDGQDDRGRQVASGVYLYRLTAGDLQATRKMVLLK